MIASTGEQVSIPCTVSGVSRQVTIWTKDGVRLSPDGRFRVASDGTLDILSVGEGDRGTYECTVENGLEKSAMKVKLNLVEHEGTLLCYYSFVFSFVRSSVCSFICLFVRH